MTIARVGQFTQDEIDVDLWEQELDQLCTAVNAKFPKAGGTISGDLTVGRYLEIAGAFKGAVIPVPMMNIFSFTGDEDKYLSDAAPVAETGTLMYRPGSIVGYTIFFKATSYVSSSTFRVGAEINGTNKFYSGNLTVNQIGTFKSNGFIARGTHTFSAGDRLSAYLDTTSAGECVGTGSVIFFVQENT